MGIIRAIYLLIRAFLMSRLSWPPRTWPCDSRLPSTHTSNAQSVAP